MEDTFLNAFNEATAQEKAAQKAQGATANINQQSYKRCISILQKYANGKVPEWDLKDLNTLLNLLNDAGFSDKALQKVNPILNNAKKQLQTQQAEQKKPEDAKAENPQGDTAAPTTEQHTQPEQKGNAANIQQGEADIIDVYLDGAAQKLGKSKDDIIAYLKTK